jgi:hypothetical protein
MKPVPDWFMNPIDVNGYEEKFVECYSVYAEKILKQPIVKFNDNTSNHSFQTHPKLLTSNPLNEEMIKQSIECYNQRLKELNDMTDKLYKGKVATLYPMVKNIIFPGDERALSSKLVQYNFGGYTSLILNKIASLGSIKTKMEPDEKSDSLYRDLMKAQAAITTSVLENVKNVKEFTKSDTYLQMLKDRSLAQKAYEKCIRENGVSRSGGVKYIRLQCAKRHNNYKLFSAEMENIRVKGGKSIATGMFMKMNGVVPNFDSMYDSTVTYLFENSYYDTREVMDDIISDESSTLYSLKKDYLKHVTPIYQYIKSLNVYNMAHAIAKFCKSLHFFSVCSLNRDNVMFDEFAPGALLIVKGGSKLYKSNRSRWFRVFYPIDRSYKDFIFPPDSSYTYFTMNEQHYVASSWINLHESLIVDGMYMAHRLTNFYIVSCLSTNCHYEKAIKDLHFQTLMMFHQRRVTEKTLHDMRYLLMNLMSYFSDYKELLKSSAMVCKDNIQGYIANSISQNLFKFYTELSVFSKMSQKKVGIMVSQDAFGSVHPITKVPISSIADLSFALYLTTMMTKAPVDNLSEQMLDFKAVIESFDKFNSEVSKYDHVTMHKETTVTLKDNFDEYLDELFSKDFNFDPKLCWTIGRFCGDYIKERVSQSDLTSFLYNEMSKPFHLVANTSGLRGRHFDSDFFGKKGYYIVYSDTSNINVDELVQILEGQGTLYEKRQKIERKNIKLIEKYIEFFDDDMILHMVHKIQKGGPREIYVMTYPTKIKQQVLEKFFGKLCTFLPNEMICVPSNKRAVWLHQRVHEHDVTGSQDLNKIFHTYDCKRWAPHCNILKYYYFISGMSHILPPAFISIFIHFWDNYLMKKLIIRGKLWTSMKNNERYKDFMEKMELVYTKRVQKTKTTAKSETFDTEEQVMLAKVIMIFSFMMGIFNYLSSLMHAANQLYVRYIIQRVTLSKRIKPLSYKSDLILSAHSDDSGGKSYNNNLNSLVVTTDLHEILMKSCNHMLSKKKSCISGVYFELTSILYIAGVFLPVLSKFASLLTFSPTDGGYVDDILTSITKTIELIQMGGNFCQAYITQKINVHMLRSFYGMVTSRADYSIPYYCLGVPDSHPLMYLLGGSEYEDLKFVSLNSKTWSLCNLFLYTLNNKMFSEKLSPSYTTFNKYYKKFEWAIELADKICTTENEKKVLKNIDNSTTFGCIAQFTKLITDNKFVWSLDYQTRTRRIVRAAWFRNANCIATNWGFTNYRKLRLLVLQLVLNLVVEEDSVHTEFVEHITTMQKIEEVAQDVENFNRILLTVFTGSDDINMLIKLLNNLKLKTEISNYVSTTIRPTSINLDIGLSPIGSNFSIDRLMIAHFAPKFLPLMRECYKDQATLSLFKSYMPPEVLKDPSLFNKVLKSYQQRVNRRFIFYSQIPRGKNYVTDYRSVMNLLSYNSYYGKELRGLQLPLSNRLVLTGEYYIWGKESELDNIIFDCYLLLSTFFNKENVESDRYWKLLQIIVNYNMDQSALFLMLNNLKKVSHKMSPLAQTIHNMLLLSYSGLYINGININLNDLNGIFFVFTKEQNRSGDRWWGKGELVIFWYQHKIKIKLEEDSAIAIMISEDIKNYHEMVSYIDLLLFENKYERISRQFKNVSSQERGLVYKIKEKSYSYDYCQEGNLFYPMIVSNTIPSLSSLVGNKNVKMRNLYRLDAEDDDGLLKIYFTPSRNISAVGMSHEFFVDDKKNRQIMEDIGYKNMAIYDFITHKAYGTDMIVEQRDLVRNIEGSEIYRIIYSSGVFPLEHEHVVPGGQGSFMHSLLKYKESNENYEFNPEYSYMLPMMSLGQIYSGSMLSHLYLDSKRVWQLLTEGQQEKVTRDSMMVLRNLKKMSTFNKDEMKILMINWGTNLPINAITLFNLDDKRSLLTSLKSSIKYFKPFLCNSMFVDICSNLLGVFLSELKVTAPMCMNKNHKMALVQNVFDGIIRRGTTLWQGRNMMCIALWNIVKSVTHNQRALNHLNNISSKSIYPVFSKVFDKDDDKIICDILILLADRVSSSIGVNKTIKDRCKDFQTIGSDINSKLNLLFDFKLTYNSVDVGKNWALRNTIPLTQKAMIPLYSKPPYNIPAFNDYNSEDEDVITDLIDEIALGDPETELFEENEDVVKKYIKKQAPTTKEIHSCYETKFSNSNLISSISDKIIIVMKGGLDYKKNKKIRGGNIGRGFITPETAEINGLPKIFWPIFYTTDNGSSYIDNLKVVSFEKAEWGFEEVVDEEYVQMGEGELSEHISRILKSVEGSVDLPDDTVSEVLNKIEKFGLDSNDFKKIKNILKKDESEAAVGEDLEKMIGMILGQFVKEGGSDEIKMKTEMVKIMKEERNRDILEKMTIIPKALGSTISSMPPITKPLISNLKLRAEMNSIAPNLADNLPSGRVMLTEEVKRMVANTCDIALMNTEHKDYDKIYCLCEVLIGLSNDALTANDSAHSDNEGFLKMTNEIMELLKGGVRTTRSKRVVPAGQVDYKSMY